MLLTLPEGIVPLPPETRHAWAGPVGLLSTVTLYASPLASCDGNVKGMMPMPAGTPTVVAPFSCSTSPEPDRLFTVPPTVNVAGPDEPPPPPPPPPQATTHAAAITAAQPARIPILPPISSRLSIRRSDVRYLSNTRASRDIPSR